MSTDTQTEHIRTMPTDRDTLRAYEIDGHLTSDDIVRVYTELLAAYQAHDKIDLLVKLTNFDGFDWSAIFTDTTYAAKTKSLTHVRRYAIVGGPQWIKTMANLFDPLFHLEMKTFDADEEKQAFDWLNEGVNTIT